MKNKEFKELMEKTTAELDKTLQDKKAKLFNLQLATGQLENTMAISACRRDIARVKTIIRRRELEA